MANTYLTPNMSLVIPVPGVDPGPDYASNQNSSFTILDSHNHSSGSGVPINPTGININSDLPFNNTNNATQLRTVRFFPNPSALSLPTDLGCIYEAGVDLYYNDGSGNQIRITQGGSVAGSAGTITGLPSGTASASYQSVSGTFQFQQSTLTAANLDVASIAIRYPGSYPTPSGNYIQLQAPTSLATGYALTLPATLPAANNAPLLVGTSGVVSTASNGDYLNPPGAISAFGGSAAPVGWLLCDGSAVSRSTYSNLFAVVGTAFGYGDNSTTFNLPDLRGQFLRGVSGTSGRDPNAGSRSAMNTGGNTANNVGSTQSSATAVNGLHDTGHAHSTGFIVTGGSSSASAYGASTRTDCSVSTQGSTANLSGDAETRPINAYVNFIIKT